MISEHSGPGLRRVARVPAPAAPLRWQNSPVLSRSAAVAAVAAALMCLVAGCATAVDHPDESVVPPPLSGPVLTEQDGRFVAAALAAGGALERMVRASMLGAVHTGRNLAEETERLVQAGLPVEVARERVVDAFISGDGLEPGSFTHAEVVALAGLAVEMYKPELTRTVHESPSPGG
ncbi:hypothetical protein [Nocardia thraciensis]